MATMSMGHFSVGSKLLQKKWNEKQYKTHKSKIASMKADIDNKNLNANSHMKMNLKKIQVEEEAKAVIDNKNKALLERVARIMRERGSIDNWNDKYKPRSLNKRLRSYEASKIQSENIHLVRRLNSIKPLYDIRKWENDFQFHEYVLQNMKATTKDYETVPNMKSPRTSPSNDKLHKEHEERMRRTAVKRIHLPKIGQPRQSPMGAKEFDPVKEVAFIHKHCQESSEVDCDALLNVIALRNFRDRMKIRNVYEKLHNEKLETVLKNCTPTSYHEIITALLSHREVYDAVTLNQTLKAEPMGNWRESVLIELICTRHDLALEAIKIAYKNEYGTTLSEDIENHTNGNLYKFLSTLMLKERSTNMEVDGEKAVTDANHLLMCDVDKRWGFSTDSAVFSTMIAEQGYAQIRAAFVEYEKLTELDVEGSVESLGENAVDDREYMNVLLAFVRCLRNCPAFFATFLHQCVHCLSMRGGQNKEKNETWAERSIIRCIVTRSEADFPQICRLYNKKYGISLYNDVNTHCNFLYKRVLMEMLKQHCKARRRATEKRIAGMIIPGTPIRASISRPVPAPLLTPHDFRNNPLNTSQRSYASIESPRDTTKRRDKILRIQDTASVKHCRDFNAEKDADVIQNVLKTWDSCDHKPLLSVLSQRSNDQRQKIRSAYASRHKIDLISDIQKNVKDVDYAEILSEWMTNRMEFDAKLLQSSLTNQGHEFVVMEIFCTRPTKHIKTACDVYRKLYGTTVIESITENVTDPIWKKILSNLAQGNKDVNNSNSQAVIAALATKLYEETVSGLSMKHFLQVFTRLNGGKIQSILSQFKKLCGKELEDVIKGSTDFQENEKEIMLLLIRCWKDPPMYFVSILHKTLSNERDLLHLLRIFITRAEVDLEIIKQVYQHKHKENLIQKMKPKLDKKAYKEFILHLLMP